MTRFYGDTVASLVAVLAMSHLNGEAERDRIAGATEFIIRQLDRMPDYLRYALISILIVFELWPLLSLKKPFSSLPDDAKLAHINEWKASGFGIAGNFVLFFDSLTIFAYYS